MTGPSVCQACSEGRHRDCGMQTWCRCECDPEAELREHAYDNMNALQDDGEENDDSPYCDCGNQPIEEEQAANQCMGCGKPLE